MKRTISFGAAVIFFLLIASGPAQTPAVPNPGEQQLLALVKEVQAQQAQIASNQVKLETKVAEVAEAVRVARIFAGRGGK